MRIFPATYLHGIIIMEKTLFCRLQRHRLLGYNYFVLLKSVATE